MQRFVLSTDPIPENVFPFGPGLGAEARFLGIVRETEGERVITGIEYSAYEPMAVRMLEQLLRQAASEFGPHEAFIQHRLGFVQAAQPSILIGVRTRHSALAFDVCRWLLQEVKRQVPIWKKPVYAPGDLLQAPLPN